MVAGHSNIWMATSVILVVKAPGSPVRRGYLTEGPPMVAGSGGQSYSYSVTKLHN
jgi:hypothetical protein